MNNESCVYIYLNGDGFVPSLLKNKTNLPIDVVIDSGEISKKGRYKDTASPYGIGIISFNLSQENLLVWSKKLVSIKKILIEYHVEEISFEIDDSHDTDILIPIELSKNLTKINATLRLRANSKR